jgi:hypothetical protein
MEPAKFKKLEDYASTLQKKGAGEEASSDFESAIATYLKLVDVLLVMADSAPSYPYWVRCTTSAENHQKKVRSLIARAALKQERQESRAQLY